MKVNSMAKNITPNSQGPNINQNLNEQLNLITQKVIQNIE